MPEMIDKIEAINRIDLRKQYTNTVHDKTLYDHCIVDIEMLPTIEAEPVRHGRWESIGGDEPENQGVCCSECDYTTACRTRFCPSCGARMDAPGTNDGGKGGADNG